MEFKCLLGKSINCHYNYELIKLLPMTMQEKEQPEFKLAQFTDKCVRLRKFTMKLFVSAIVIQKFR